MFNIVHYLFTKKYKNMTHEQAHNIMLLYGQYSFSTFLSLPCQNSFFFFDKHVTIFITLFGIKHAIVGSSFLSSSKIIVCLASLVIDCLILKPRQVFIWENTDTYISYIALKY